MPDTQEQVIESSWTTSTSSEISVSISPRRVAQVLAGVVAFLLIAHFVLMYCVYFLGRTSVFGLVRRFDLLKEITIPTWYSAATLLVSAGLLAVIGYAKKATNDRFARHWLGLSIIFVYLSVDESAMIHETVQSQLRRLVEDEGGLLYSLMSIVYLSLFATVVFVVYLRFLIGLPRRTRLLFLTAGGVFVAGALGGDFIGELYKNAHGVDNFTFATMNGIEEGMEMTGIIIFIYALLDHIGRHVGPIRIQVE